MSPSSRQRSIRASAFALSSAVILVLAASPCRALDKQGSAHDGDIAGSNSGFDVSGSATLGVSLYNPTYAARPDNTGLTLMRYALHSDVDLIGRRLSIPIDVNMFTDRKLGGAKALVPTELDFISGVTSTWPLGPGALELASRLEHDAQVGPTQTSELASVGGVACGRGGLCTQTYVDARARYLYSLSALAPDLRRALARGDISGWLMLGYFALNPSYAARPDNSGRALFRYAIHSQLSVYDDVLAVALDATMFTDRGDRPFAPSELDFTPELIFHRAPFEVHLAYERDMPLSTTADDEAPVAPEARGVVQSFVYALFAWNFDLHDSTKTEPLEERERIPSP